MAEIALADSSTCITPNPVIRPKSATGNGIYYFLLSSIFLLVSWFSFVLDVARYALEPMTKHLTIKSVPILMTDWEETNL